MGDIRPVALVTGATGLLGPYLVDALTGSWQVVTSAQHGGSVPANLTSEADVDHLMTIVHPSIVVHSAAMTDIDHCERDPDAADAINHLAVRHLTGRLDGARMVVVSTDQVYSDTAGPHAEGTENPVNRYGGTKLAGEKAALASPGTLVLRTNFFGPSRTPGRESLSDFMINRLSSRCRVTLFSDVRFNPLHIESLAKILAAAVQAGLTGVYNVGSRGGCTKLDFGLSLARHLGLPSEEVTAGRSDDVLGRAPRPHDLRMDVTRFEIALGTTLPHIDDEVRKL